MTIESTIKKFCADAVELTLSLNGNFLRQFKNNSERSRFDKDILKDVEISKVDIHRSIICNNGDVLFILDIDYHDDVLENALERSLSDAKKIEAAFPNMFLWNFTGGGGIHGIAYIKFTPENEKRIKRYGYIFDFYKSFIDFINSTAKTDIEKTFVHYRGLTRSIGSFHYKHGLHSIPIRLDWSTRQILDFSKAGFMFNWSIPSLNIEKIIQIVPVINYNYKACNSYTSTRKVPIEYNKYPPCIIKLFNMKNKGNMERFEIIRYLLGLHSKSDVYNFLKMVLSTAEYGKAKTEGQIHFILHRKYPPPTCHRMMSMKMCCHCGRAAPSVLRDRKFDNDNKK